MLNSEQVGDLIEAMVGARVANDEPTLIDIVDGLMTGQVVDLMNVVLVMAGVLAEEFDEMESDSDFHSVTVTRVEEDGSTSVGSVDELPGHVATFARMVAALANDDRSMAVDLFIGFVGTDGLRALPLLVFALNEVVHTLSDCPVCHQDPETS